MDTRRISKITIQSQKDTTKCPLLGASSLPWHIAIYPDYQLPTCDKVIDSA